ncbi:MAG: DoxX family membrane protein [Candidatus Yanofskybacteria bacterium]|nr:DoxX family membrane protein [Candidatus Yanofskybacteria bacterium]
MFESLRYSQLSLRIGLAFVFLWFGVDAFLQPAYWVQAWMPDFVQRLTVGVGMGTENAMFLFGMFEVIVAVSIATGFFMRYFAAAAAAFLLGILVTHGLNEVVVRDVGIIAGLIALVLWPERRYFS